MFFYLTVSFTKNGITILKWILADNGSISIKCHDDINFETFNIRDYLVMVRSRKSLLQHYQYRPDESAS